MRNIVIVMFIAILCSCASKPSENGNLGYSGKGKGVFGFSSVQEALTELRNKPQTKTWSMDGWTIINDEENHSVWSFAPSSHPAHPSVVKRSLSERNGSVFMRTQVSCGASKAICDSLVKEFMALNEKIKSHVSGQ